jgi:hypothetical protein
MPHFAELLSRHGRCSVCRRAVLTPAAVLTRPRPAAALAGLLRVGTLEEIAAVFRTCSRSCTDVVRGGPSPKRKKTK